VIRVGNDVVGMAALLSVMLLPPWPGRRQPHGWLNKRSSRGETPFPVSAITRRRPTMKKAIPVPIFDNERRSQDCLTFDREFRAIMEPRFVTY
jgi:hypothetical protein